MNEKTKETLNILGLLCLCIILESIKNGIGAFIFIITLVSYYLVKYKKNDKRKITTN